MEMLIAESRFSTFVKNVEKMNKKAVKKGLAPFTWHELSRSIEIVRNEDGKEWPIQAITISITGPEIKAGTFGLVGKIDRRSSPVLYSSIPLEIPAKYLDTSECQHCHTIRTRKETWLIRNEDTEELLQVGTSCLEEYTGITPATAMLHADLWTAMQALVAGFTWEGGGSGGTFVPDSTIPLYWGIGLCREAILGKGYTSRRKADESGCPATANVAWNRYEAGDKFLPSTESDIEYILNWANEKYGKLEAGLPWDMSVRSVVKDGKASLHSMGIVAWLVHAWMQEYEAEPVIFTHVGTPGKSVELEVLVYDQILMPMRYASRAPAILHKMKDMLGNHLCWFCNGKTLPIGKHTVKATVKAHSEYNGVPQTTLIRVKELAPT